MLKRVVLFFMLGISVVFFSGTAWSSVAGDWDMTVKGSVSVKVPGYGSASEKFYGFDDFTFYSNGLFESNGMNGTWVQQKKKFIITLDTGSIESQMEELFGDLCEDEYSCDDIILSFFIRKVKFSGTEGKNTVKGTLTMDIDVYVYDFYTDEELKARVKLSANYKGTRSTFQASSGLKKDAHGVVQPVVESMKTILKEVISLTK